jgi:hypothetical protein
MTGDETDNHRSILFDAEYPSNHFVASFSQ